MVMYEPEALDKLIKICQENGVLTIADEVMTGFGKTGKTFACDYLQTQPDMMCLSKALTGGTIPMAITTFTQDLFDAFYFTIVTVSTVGFGDISPQTSGGRLVAMAMIFSGLGVSASTG